MAGSYRHVTKDDGSFRGTGLLDNSRDVYEALEECIAMINELSGGDRAKIHEAWRAMKLKLNPTCQEDLLTYAALWDREVVRERPRRAPSIFDAPPFQPKPRK
jgi:hypothetical protein